MDSDLVVYVAQYSRGVDANRKTLTMHWEICIQTSEADQRPRGNIYHIKGSRADYKFEKLVDRHFTTTGNWRGMVKVGTVAKSSLPGIEQLFREVQIHTNNPDWGCRNWVSNALRKLYARGYGIDPILAQWEGLNHMMDMVLKAWEDGDL
ncbi:uncharacterized protein FIBRA_03905 [Fibroporia radiculosa]|uniref:Uncharacterized protein n=1 Tax=Fibroporia radiculosa TaxID=599839 RepID=J4HW88_9APHY|nr:uncharacterized protein FIBRA_03905 [Fibroporia radiculosa]CCM01837.1 predicted protein [Fibroporia radiculosa]